jgi:pentatricopeptide repeat protein
MIAAYLRMQTDPRAVCNVFNRFQELVNHGHESIALLAESDYIYNVFLMAFLRDVRTLQHCVTVVETMLRPLPTTAVCKAQNNRPIQPAEPTVQTWTILLAAFMYHRQPQAVGKIREVMLKRGVQFNNVTWNVIISGFANMQMVSQTATALMMMEEEKWPIDAYTLLGVRRLREPGRLREAMDALDANWENVDKINLSPDQGNNGRFMNDQLSYVINV